MDIVDKARTYAIACHIETNHLYDGKPYEVHLQMVYEEALKYSFLVEPGKRENFLAAAWVHDVIEDCRQTYNDVLQATNQDVAELAFALTNEKGKTRKDRANEKYYSEMKKVPYAVLLKVCDRIANMRYSIENDSPIIDMYRKETKAFIEKLSNGSCEEAFADLISLGRRS